MPKFKGELGFSLGRLYVGSNILEQWLGPTLQSLKEATAKARQDASVGQADAL